MEYLYEKAQESAEYIKMHTTKRPKIAVVLGSGLGNLTADFTETEELPYKDIPNFPVSTVAGHKGALLAGKLGEKEVYALEGRFHFYEGYSMKEVCYPFYVLKLLGVEQVVLTNACGGINREFAPGTLMLLTDFINMMGTNPLIGPNDERFGPRFPDMTEPYSLELRNLAKQTADALIAAVVGCKADRAGVVGVDRLRGLYGAAKAADLRAAGDRTVVRAGGVGCRLTLGHEAGDVVAVGGHAAVVHAAQEVCVLHRTGKAADIAPGIGSRALLGRDGDVRCDVRKGDVFRSADKAAGIGIGVAIVLRDGERAGERQILDLSLLRFRALHIAEEAEVRSADRFVIGIEGDAHAGDAVAVAVKITGERLLQGADRGPAFNARQVDVGRQLAADAGLTAVDLAREPKQLAGVADEVDTVFILAGQDVELELGRLRLQAVVGAVEAVGVREDDGGLTLFDGAFLPGHIVRDIPLETVGQLGNDLHAGGIERLAGLIGHLLRAFRDLNGQNLRGDGHHVAGVVLVVDRAGAVCDGGADTVLCQGALRREDLAVAGIRGRLRLGADAP